MPILNILVLTFLIGYAICLIYFLIRMRSNKVQLNNHIKTFQPIDAKEDTTKQPHKYIFSHDSFKFPVLVEWLNFVSGIQCGVYEVCKAVNDVPFQLNVATDAQRTVVTCDNPGIVKELQERYEYLSKANSVK